MSTIQIHKIVSSVYRIMSDGKSYNVASLLPRVQEMCGFTDDQMKEVDSGKGQLRVKKYIQFAIHYLYAVGLIYKSSRGIYKITPSQQALILLDDKELYDAVMKIYRQRDKSSAITKDPISDGDVIEKALKVFPSLSDERYAWTIGCLCFMDTPSDKATRTKGIYSLLVDDEEEISLEDLQNIWKRANEQRSINYELEIKFENRGNKKDPKMVVDFTVKDDRGNNYPLKLETVWKAVYLTFLYFEDGILLDDFCNAAEKANNIFQKIYDSSYNKKGTVKKYTYYISDAENYKEIADKIEAAKTALTDLLSKIRTSIADALPNNRAARPFVISDREEKQTFRIQATNQGIRDAIKKHFALN